MKAVKKFTTFEDLKLYESKTVDYAVRLKKHKEFEKVIMDIRSNKVRKSSNSKSK